MFGKMFYAMTMLVRGAFGSVFQRHVKNFSAMNIPIGSKRSLAKDTDWWRNESLITPFENCQRKPFGVQCLSCKHVSSRRTTNSLPLLAERGEAKIAVIFLDDEPISGVYMLCKNTTYYGIITDYDQKYQEYSPGIVLLNYQLEYLLQGGGNIFDFCGADYDYKKKYATGYQNHSTFQIFHSGWKSRFVYSAKTCWLPLLRKILRKPAPKDFIGKSKHF